MALAFPSFTHLQTQTHLSTKSIHAKKHKKKYCIYQKRGKWNEASQVTTGRLQSLGIRLIISTVLQRHVRSTARRAPQHSALGGPCGPPGNTYAAQVVSAPRLAEQFCENTSLDCMTNVTIKIIRTIFTAAILVSR